ncbi:hypothetical protein ACHHV8_16775 [Paenibacillus sp. TAB 01]|uniref:hypothetical protein n=1 Tax=Paenibacillus sp. TAB 01 TaxID=3368988 RepID=UPI003750DB5E
MSGLERSLAVKYAPVLYFDRREPFYPVRVGITVFTEPGPSPSFRRKIKFDVPDISFVIEYAIYWDYDIQHLYELEHVWVYVGRSGEVLDAEASFHGKYLKSLLPQKSNLDGTHVRLYSQPGKHAFSPMKELFELVPNLRTAAGDEAGADGLTVPDMLRGRLSSDAAVNRLVREHLQSLAFEPSMQFEAYRIPEELYTIWNQLYEEIPGRIESELAKLRARYQA